MGTSALLGEWNEVHGFILSYYFRVGMLVRRTNIRVLVDGCLCFSFVSGEPVCRQPKRLSESTVTLRGKIHETRRNAGDICVTCLLLLRLMEQTEGTNRLMRQGLNANEVPAVLVFS